MTIDISKEYDDGTKSLLKNLRKDIITNLAIHHDHKKILSFLARCALIQIDDQAQDIHVGIPNEFVASQVKKFFGEDMQKSVHQVYGNRFSLRLSVFPPLQKGTHELHIDIKKLLNIDTNKATVPVEQHFKKELTQHFGILFDRNFRFDTLVSGAHNELAVSAATAIADNPGQVYNPFFIYGNVGLGKTHIMQAVGNHIIKKYPEKVVVYLPTSKLIDEIVISIRKNKLGQLMQKLDQVDVLLLDDIQFIAQKEKTQEIFHNIFNDFHNKKKQIVITSDRPPKELNDIAERLKSRFSLGLVADIQSPDFETRIAILKSKADTKGFSIEDKHLEIIAQHITTNVRELEGALNIIINKERLTGKTPDQDSITNCLRTLGYIAAEPTKEVATSNGTYISRTLNFNDIVFKVANYYQLTTEDIKSESRKKEISQARQLLMLIAKKEFNRTLERIGTYFGGKNHATVIYAIKNIEDKIKSDEYVSKDYEKIMKE